MAPRVQLRDEVTGEAFILEVNTATGKVELWTGDGASSLEVLQAESQAYEKIVIWAEESGGMTNNNSQFSFGNGATGSIGVPLVEDWEIYAVSFQADVFSGAGPDMAVLDMGDSVTTTTLLTFTAATNPYTEILAAPVPAPAGTGVGFRTVTENGTHSDVRVAAWLRRQPA